MLTCSSMPGPKMDFKCFEFPISNLWKEPVRTIYCHTADIALVQSLVKAGDIVVQARDYFSKGECVYTKDIEVTYEISKGRNELKDFLDNRITIYIDLIFK